MSNITPIAAAIIGSVTVSRTRTVNLGNYENEQVFVSVTLPVTASDDYQARYNEATTFVQENIEAEVAALGGKTINKVAAKRIAKDTASSQTTDTPAAEETEAEETSTPVRKVKQQDVRAALKDIKDNIGNDEYKEVLAKFGAKAFNALEEDDYAAVLDACKIAKKNAAALAENEANGIDEEVEEETGDEETGAEESTDDDDLDGEEENVATITLDEFKTACKQYNADNGAGSHKAILSDAGYASLNEVPASDYASLMADMI